MFPRLPLFVLTILTFLTLFPSTLAAPVPKAAYYPWNPVHFRSTYSSIPPDTNLELAWEGGSGDGFEVYYIPQWADQGQYYPIDIAHTSSRSFKWRTPKADAFPAGTTFIVGVNDVHVGPGSEWYDLTSLVQFGKK